MIHIKKSFTKKEVAVLRAENADDKFCDANNFCYFNFKDKEVKAADKDKATAYLVEKAVKAGAKAVK